MVWILQILLATLAIALAMSLMASSNSMMGGIEEFNVNDKGVQQVVDYFFKIYNGKNNDQ
jgi:hypothetical protein